MTRDTVPGSGLLACSVQADLQPLDGGALTAQSLNCSRWLWSCRSVLHHDAWSKAACDTQALSPNLEAP